MNYTDLIIRLSALICVSALAITAMVKGIDNVILKAAFVLIGLIAGVSASTITTLIKRRDGSQ